MTRRCGYIALLGKPNAGKSTLLNACVGQKIAGVSKRPQTTRNKILGIRSQGENQFVFLDTPGMHRTKNTNRMNSMMNREAWGVINEADLNCYLVDSKFGITEEDESHLKSLLTQTDKKLLVLCTKSDAIKKFLLEEAETQIGMKLRQLKEGLTVTAQLVSEHVYTVSAKRPEDIEEFCGFIAKFLPEGDWMFGEDDLTDRPQNFIVAEMIREQIFRQLGDELPYGTSVIIDEFDESETLVKIMATIIIARESHKSIVIGKKGSRIKDIGTKARETLEQHLEKKVFLDLFVKVHENWIDNDTLVTQFEGLGQ